jgi:fatty acid desaturase
MKKNLGIADRVVRILVVMLIAVLYLTQMISGIVAIVLLTIAGVLLLTSIFSTCPIYAALGLSSRKEYSKHS